MISIEMSVREALLVYESATHNIPLREKVAQAIERATVHTSFTEEASLTVYSIDHKKFIDCIKVFRGVTRWGLKESKEFFDVIRGEWKWDHYSGGTRNTLGGFSRSDCEKLYDQLRSLGCDCSVSR